MTTKQSTKKTAAPKTNGSDDGYHDAEQLLQPAGYWDPAAGPLHGQLVGGYEFRQKSGRGKGKLKRIFVFRLLDACPARIKTESANGKSSLDDGELSRGDLCAVFDSAGLRSLNDLAGCAVKLSRAPEKKELPNGNSMWLYTIRFKGERKPLRVRQAFESEKDEGEDDTSFDPDDFSTGF